MTARDATKHELRLAGHSGHLARQAALRAEACLRSALPPTRTLRELAILAVLAEQPMSQARLGALLQVNRTLMISVIDDIETAHLVRRERDPADRRRYALRITDKGRVVLTRLLAAAEEAERNLTATLGPPGRRRLNELLRLLVPDRAEPLPSRLVELTGFLLEHVSLRLRVRSEQALRDCGLKPRCVRMLLALDATQPCTQERLASSMSLAAPTIIGALDELHEGGLILRDRNPKDRREHILQLSADGKRYLTDALRAEDAAQADLADLIGVTEIAELNTLLSALTHRDGS